MTMAVILLAMLSYAGPPTPSTLFREADGGWANRVNTATITGGSGGGPSYVNALIDGGSITVIQGTSPWVTSGGSGVSYVNALLDGGFTTAHITNWPATQPVSISSMPSTPVTGTFWQATQPVSGTFWQATQSVSAASLPLPSGAATSANQTTLGSATTKINDGTDTALITATSGGSLQVECTAGCGSPATPVMYKYATPAVVAGVSKLYLDIFNASGSGKIIKILGVYPVIKTDVAVVGVVSIRFDIYRTSAVGTGGTVNAYKSGTIDVAGGNITPADTNNANLPAQITARHLPTGGATISEWISPHFCFVEETNAGTYWCNGMFNVLDTGGWSMQAMVLREGQGMLLKQGTVATLNSISFIVKFTTE